MSPSIFDLQKGSECHSGYRLRSSDHHIVLDDFENFHFLELGVVRLL